MSFIVEWNFFRLDITTPAQMHLELEEDTDRPSLIRKILGFSINRDVLVKKSNWILGELTDSEEVLCFQIGRVTKFRHPARDEQNKRFYEFDDTKTPFTKVIISPDTGLIAIAKNPNLSQTIKTTSAALEKIISISHPAVNSGLDFRIGPIPDESKLIERIRRAAHIKYVQIEFTRENPRNLAKIFHQEPKKLLTEIGAQHGKLRFIDGEMNRDHIVEIVSSAAKASNDIEIKMTPEGEQTKKTVVVRLSESQIATFFAQPGEEIKKFNQKNSDMYGSS